MDDTPSRRRYYTHMRSTISLAVLCCTGLPSCYLSAESGAGPPTDATDASKSDSAQDTAPDGVAGKPVQDTEAAPEPDSDTRAAPSTQGPVTFRIQNFSSAPLFFDLTVDRWMALQREDPEPSDTMYLEQPLCIEPCREISGAADPLCRRPCITETKTYVLYPGDEVSVVWDGAVRVLDPELYPTCFCYLETAPPPGRYAVTLAAFSRYLCVDSCELPPKSGISSTIILDKSAGSLLWTRPFDIPYLEDEFFFTFPE